MLWWTGGQHQHWATPPHTQQAAKPSVQTLHSQHYIVPMLNPVLLSMCSMFTFISRMLNYYEHLLEKIIKPFFMFVSIVFCVRGHFQWRHHFKLIYPLTLNPVTITIGDGSDTKQRRLQSGIVPLLAAGQLWGQQATHTHMHNSQYTEVPVRQRVTPPHREGDYYVDSDVATHFASAMCYRQTHAGATSHSTSSDLTSAPPSWVSPLSEIRRHSPPGGLLPPLLDDRASRAYLRRRGAGVINLKRQVQVGRR